MVKITKFLARKLERVRIFTIIRCEFMINRCEQK